MDYSSIPNFYQGRCIFVTGATGFMGKILVQKLLRSCPEIDQIYLLLRPLAGKTAASRLEELIKNEVFDWIRDHHPKRFDKLVPVAGNVSSTALGLSSIDQQRICASVSVVFHMAARIKFDDDLKSAIESNVKGPQKVALFCRQMEKLKAFVHVSTVFNNLDKGEIEEIVYPSPTDAQKLMDFIDGMDDAVLASITKQLVGNCPNVYAFTKALGEQVLEKDCKNYNIPLAIVRPSIVTASLEEPFPGWIDNLNGPSGFVTGIGKGFIRTCLTDCKLIGDLIPVDIAINLIIAVAWESALKGRKDLGAKVYNCATGFHNPLTWQLFNQYGMATWAKYPTRDMIWYPGVNYRTNLFLHRAEIVLYHYLPAYLFDLIAKITRRRPFMVRLYDKVHRALACLNFYVTREWKFVSNNPISLLEKMSEEDRRVFFFDVRKINWESYITNYILGCRKFLLKDRLDTLPIARRNLKRLYWIRTLARFTLLGLFGLFLYFLLQVLT